MRPPSTISIVISILIFGIVGLVMHELVGPNLCAHQIRVGIATVLVLILLILTLCLPKEKHQGGWSIRRVLSYVLVVGLSVGIWYEIWSTQACNATTRDNTIHQD